MFTYNIVTLKHWQVLMATNTSGWRSLNAPGKWYIPATDNLPKMCSDHLRRNLAPVHNYVVFNDCQTHFLCPCCCILHPYDLDLNNPLHPEEKRAFRKKQHKDDSD